MELDQVLVFLGDFGRFQTLVYILICLAGQVPSAWHMLAISFLGAVPDYRCDAPPGDQPEETAVPEADGGSVKISSQCEQYVNVSVDNTTEPCGDGWVYDSTYGNTIVTEVGQNLIQQLEYLLYHFHTLYCLIICYVMHKVYVTRP